MKSMLNKLVIVAAMLLVSAPALHAEPKFPIKENRLGIGRIKVNPSVKASLKGVDANSLQRIAEALDSQLIDRFHNTRKFEVVSRSDLSDVLDEQALAASGNIDADDTAAARAFELAGCKYIVITTIDGFQDYIETARFEAIGEQATKRILQLSAVAKVINTTDGVVLETANFQIGNRDVATSPNFVHAHGNLNDGLTSDLARMLAEQVANRVVDVIFPARVIAMTDKTVTINRGDGTGIAVGQEWEVFAIGDELVDPDTGASLGREEVRVGLVRITAVQPMFSRGEVLEDLGVDKLHILRMKAPAPQPDGMR